MRKRKLQGDAVVAYRLETPVGDVMMAPEPKPGSGVTGAAAKDATGPGRPTPTVHTPKQLPLTPDTYSWGGHPCIRLARPVKAVDAVDPVTDRPPAGVTSKV